jgi:hypothetical protein
MDHLQHPFALLIVHGVHGLDLTIGSCVLVFSGQTHTATRIIIITTVGLICNLAMEACDSVAADRAPPLLSVSD